MRPSSGAFTSGRAFPSTWVVDPELDVIRVYRRAGESFGRTLELTRETGDTLTTSLLPGLELPLARIFED